MLTPANIKNHRFQVVGRGFYKTGDVDDYLSQVASSYEMLFRENKELIRKMSLLANRLEEYRNDEEKIRKAVVQAQQLAARLIDDAKKAAEEIIDNADTKARSAESIADIRIKKKIDYVEEQIKDTFDKARAQAKNATDKAELEAQSLINEAKLKASELIDSAAEASKQQLESIERQINSQSVVLSRLKEESSMFKADILKRYEQQISLIKEIPDSIFDELGINREDSEEHLLRDSLNKALDSYFADEAQLESDKNYKSEITESIEETLNNSNFDDFEESSEFSVEEDATPKTPLAFEDVFSYSDPSQHKSLFEENEPYDINVNEEDSYNFLDDNYQNPSSFEIVEDEGSDDFIEKYVEETADEVIDDFTIIDESDSSEAIIEDGISFDDDFIPDDKSDSVEENAEENTYDDIQNISDSDSELTEYEAVIENISEANEDTESEAPQFSIDDITLDDIFKFDNSDNYSEFLGYDESMFEDKKATEIETINDESNDSEQGFTITIDADENFENTVDFDFVSDENDEEDSTEDGVGFLKGLFNK